MGRSPDPTHYHSHESALRLAVHSTVTTLKRGRNLIATEPEPEIVAAISEMSTQGEGNRERGEERKGESKKRGGRVEDKG